MSILKYKYKAHKLINTLFYVIVFGVGFLLGFGAEKINYNKLISQILMIDNVSALSFEEMTWDSTIDAGAYTTRNKSITYSSISVKPTSTTYYDEDYIYSLFNEVMDLFSLDVSFIDYSNVFTIYYKSGVWNDFYFYFSPSDFSGTYSKLISTGPQFISIHISKYESTAQLSYKSCDNGAESCTMTLHSGSYSGASKMASTSTNITGLGNYMDFSEYMFKLEYNENLFKDNTDFKEVCIEKGKKYAITTINLDSTTNTIFTSDFLWFPGKTTGVKYSEYDSLSDDNILIFNDDISTENYYFENKEKIDTIYNDEIISNYFNNSGYTDKYLYYGYTAYKFIHSYYVDDNNNPQNMFTIFDFSKINFSPFGSSGGSSSSFGDTPLTYCFYIKTDFNVTELKNNEWNDYIGTVPTPGGNLDVITSHNKNNNTNKTDLYFSNINNFINEIGETVNFINSYILELYTSMPLIVRSFILSFLVLILIRILIGMVVK